MKYRKKPVIIEAEQFFSDCLPWPEGVISSPGCNQLVIKTLEGFLLVREGDFIITGIEGEKYPCKPNIFEATYEKVDENTSESNYCQLCSDQNLVMLPCPKRTEHKRDEVAEQTLVVLRKLVLLLSSTVTFGTEENK